MFTDEELKRGTERDLKELLQRAPNVTTDPFSNAMIVRGVAENGIDEGGFAGVIPNVTAYVDGLYSPTTQNLWDTRQVEVLRGPQNFLSNGAMAGLTNVTSNGPTDHANGQMSASWAPDTNDRSLGLAYGGPLSDRLTYRLAGYARDTDGYMDNPTRNQNDWNSAHEYDGRVRLDWRPWGDDDTRVMFRGEHQQYETRGSNALHSTDPGVDPFAHKTWVDTQERDEQEHLAGQFKVTHRFNEHWQGEFFFGGHEVHWRGTADRDGTDQPSGYVQRHYDFDYAGTEVRLFYEDGPWQAFFRQYALHLDQKNGYTDNFIPIDVDGPGPTPGVTANARYFSSTPNWWFIGTQMGTRRAIGRFTIAVSLLRAGQVLNGHRGVQSTRVDTTGIPALDDIYDSIIGTPAYFPNSDITQDLTEFNYLPTLVLSYDMSDAVTVGAKYERGARLGGIWFNVARATANKYDSELSDNYDLFVRGSWLEERLEIRANAFYTRITQQQVYAQLTNTPFDAQFVNAQRAHTDGLEIESSWVSGNLRIWLSAALLHAEFDKVEVFNINYSGNDFPNAPDWTASFGFIYVGPQGLFVAADTSLRPETKGSLDNRPGIVNQQRTLVNARIGWDFREAELSLYARNLLDEEYLAYHDADIATGGAFQTYVVGAPREVGMTVSMHF